MDNKRPNTDYCNNVFILQGHPLYEKPEEKAFSGCKYMQEITIPDTWTYIPKYCFSGCSSLKIIHGGKNIKYINTGAFAGCTSLNTLDFQAPFLHYIQNNYYNKANISEQSIDRCFEIKEKNFYGVIIDDSDPLYNGVWDVIEHTMFYSKKELDYKKGDLVKCTYKPVVIKEEPSNGKTLFRWFNQHQCAILGYYTTDKNADGILDKHLAVYYYYKKLYQYDNNIISFIEKNKEYIATIDIEDVINNYKSSIDENCIRRVGKDDIWTLNIHTGTIISDIYIDKILPPESIHEEEYTYGGYPTWRHQEEEYRNGQKWIITKGIDYNREEREKRNEEIRINARKTYSQEEHLKAIINNTINNLLETYYIVKSELQVERAECLISKCRKDTDYIVCEYNGNPIGKYVTKHIPYTEFIELINKSGLHFSIMELKSYKRLFFRQDNKGSNN